jgi:hypothetical protein
MPARTPGARLTGMERRAVGLQALPALPVLLRRHDYREVLRICRSRRSAAAPGSAMRCGAGGHELVPLVQRVAFPSAMTAM